MGQEDGGGEESHFLLFLALKKSFRKSLAVGQNTIFAWGLGSHLFLEVYFLSNFLKFPSTLNHHFESKENVIGLGEVCCLAPSKSIYTTSR